MKRSFDLILASIIFMPLLVLMFFIAIAIIFTSKGSPLHWSDRVGANNRIFKMPKFRTMKIDTPEVATHLLSNPDNFLTPIGGFLRKSSLDELPQFLNVLRGDMSVVGNRPLPLYEAVELTTDQWAARFLAPAGITGLWQVEKRGKEEMSETERKELDIEYALNVGLRMDLRIILKTVPALMQRENV